MYQKQRQPYALNILDAIEKINRATQRASISEKV